MPHTRKLFRSATLLFALMLTACGGGGSGDPAPATTPNRLTYTGSTAQATVNADNAEALAVGAYLGEQNGMAVSLQTSVTSPDASDSPSMRSVSQLLRRALRHEAPAIQTKRLVQLAAAQGTPQAFPGPCGGQFLSNPVWSPETGSFTDLLEFQDFCEDGLVLKGKVAVTGTIDSGSGIVNSFTMSFHPLAVTSGENFTLDGQIRVNFGGPQFAETVAMDILQRDDATSQVYRYENFLSGINYGPGFVEEMVSGRYYHPTHGYIDLNTEQALRIFGGLPWPSAGVLRCNGLNTPMATS